VNADGQSKDVGTKSVYLIKVCVEGVGAEEESARRRGRREEVIIHTARS
jgi:hypothetical protein